MNVSPSILSGSCRNSVAFTPVSDDVGDPQIRGLYCSNSAHQPFGPFPSLRAMSKGTKHTKTGKHSGSKSNSSSSRKTTSGPGRVHHHHRQAPVTSPEPVVNDSNDEAEDSDGAASDLNSLLANSSRKRESRHETEKRRKAIAKALARNKKVSTVRISA